MKIDRLMHGNAFAPCPAKNGRIKPITFAGIVIFTFINLSLIGMMVKLLHNGQ